MEADAKERPAQTQDATADATTTKSQAQAKPAGKHELIDAVKQWASRTFRRKTAIDREDVQRLVGELEQGNKPRTPACYEMDATTGKMSAEDIDAYMKRMTDAQEDREAEEAAFRAHLKTLSPAERDRQIYEAQGIELGSIPRRRRPAAIQPIQDMPSAGLSTSRRVQTPDLKPAPLAIRKESVISNPESFEAPPVTPVGPAGIGEPERAGKRRGKVQPSPSVCELPHPLEANPVSSPDSQRRYSSPTPPELPARFAYPTPPTSPQANNATSPRSPQSIRRLPQGSHAVYGDGDIDIRRYTIGDFSNMSFSNVTPSNASTAQYHPENMKPLSQWRALPQNYQEYLERQHIERRRRRPHSMYTITTPHFTLTTDSLQIEQITVTPRRELYAEVARYQEGEEIRRRMHGEPDRYYGLPGRINYDPAPDGWIWTDPNTQLMQSAAIAAVSRRYKDDQAWRAPREESGRR